MEAEVRGQNNVDGTVWEWRSDGARWTVDIEAAKAELQAATQAAIAKAEEHRKK